MVLDKPLVGSSNSNSMVMVIITIVVIMGMLVKGVASMRIEVVRRIWGGTTRDNWTRIFQLSLWRVGGPGVPALFEIFGKATFGVRESSVFSGGRYGCPGVEIWDSLGGNPGLCLGWGGGDFLVREGREFFLGVFVLSGFFDQICS
jgi:hypothetical protein